MADEVKVPEVLGREETPIEVSTDAVVQIAENAEKRVQAVKKIKQLALSITTPNDWVDMGGRPYLTVSGAEKIARLFGISWRIGEPKVEYEDDGHFRYIYQGEFIMGNVSIEAIGTRSSRDPFFSRSHGRDIPPNQIDKADVMKAAYTNCIGNGITRLLGLRNLTWDDLRVANIKPSARVEYKSTKVTTKETPKDTKDPKEDPNHIEHWRAKIKRFADMLQSLGAYDEYEAITGGREADEIDDIEEAKLIVSDLSSVANHVLDRRAKADEEKGGDAK